MLSSKETPIPIPTPTPAFARVDSPLIGRDSEPNSDGLGPMLVAIVEGTVVKSASCQRIEIPLALTPYGPESD